MRRLFFNVVPSWLVLNETVRHSFSLGVFLSFFFYHCRSLKIPLGRSGFQYFKPQQFLEDPISVICILYPFPTKHSTRNFQGICDFPFPSKVTSWKLLSIGTASEKLHFSRLLTAVTWFLYLFVLLGSNPVAVSHLPTSCRASLGTHRQGALWKKIRESTSLHLYFWSLESQAMISSPCEGRSI